MPALQCVNLSSTYFLSSPVQSILPETEQDYLRVVITVMKQYNHVNLKKKKKAAFNRACLQLQETSSLRSTEAGR